MTDTTARLVHHQDCNVFSKGTAAECNCNAAKFQTPDTDGPGRGIPTSAEMIAAGRTPEAMAAVNTNPGWTKPEAHVTAPDTNAPCVKCHLEVWAGCEDVNCPTLLEELKMTDTKIVELMPDMDTWPEWAIIARDHGSLFRTCMEKIAYLTTQIADMKEIHSPALRTLQDKLDYALMTVDREKAICETASDDATRLGTENQKLCLDLKCLEESTVDSKAYDALTEQLEQAACAGEGHLREIQVLTMALDYDAADDDAEFEPPHPIFALVAERDAYAEQIKELQSQLEQHQWHRVEDELPDERGMYLVSNKGVLGWLAWHPEKPGWENEHCFPEHPDRWRYSTPPEVVSE